MDFISIVWDIIPMLKELGAQYSPQFSTMKTGNHAEGGEQISRMSTCMDSVRHRALGSMF